MLRLLSRAEAYGINPHFTDFISGWQDLAGEEHRDRHSFPPPARDVAQADAIRYAHADNGFYARLDDGPREAHAAALARSLRAVGERLGIGKFHFLGEASTPS